MKKDQNQITIDEIIALTEEQEAAALAAVEASAAAAMESITQQCEHCPTRACDWGICDQWR